MLVSSSHKPIAETIFQVSETKLTTEVTAMKKFLLILSILFGISPLVAHAEDYACTYTVKNATGSLAYIDTNPESATNKIFLHIEPNSSSSWSEKCSGSEKTVAIVSEINNPACFARGNSVRFVTIESNKPMKITSMSTQPGARCYVPEVSEAK
jgi:hypothetical protein